MMSKKILNKHSGCILFQGFYVGWMRGTLVYNNSLSLKIPLHSELRRPVGIKNLFRFCRGERDTLDVLARVLPIPMLIGHPHSGKSSFKNNILYKDLLNNETRSLNFRAKSRPPCDRGDNQTTITCKAFPAEYIHPIHGREKMPMSLGKTPLCILVEMAPLVSMSNEEDPERLHSPVGWQGLLEHVHILRPWMWNGSWLTSHWKDFSLSPVFTCVLSYTLLVTWNPNWTPQWRNLKLVFTYVNKEHYE